MVWSEVAGTAKTYRPKGGSSARHDGAWRNPMMTPAYVRTMAAYNSEMNRRLYAAASRLSDAERKRDRNAFCGSLHNTLVHILWGDGQWMSRFDGWQRPTTPIKESGHMLGDYASSAPSGSR